MTTKGKINKKTKPWNPTSNKKEVTLTNPGTTIDTTKEERKGYPSTIHQGRKTNAVGTEKWNKEIKRRK